MIKRINETINEYLIKELRNINIHTEYVCELKKELLRFKTDEDLLKCGGLSIELLDRLAFGFSEKDITALNPIDLKIRWKTDYENVLYEIKHSGLSKKQYALKIDLSEPIDVSYMEYNGLFGFYIEDGHHRYVAAKILNKILSVNLEIKINPIKVIAPNMGYDELHKYLFELYVG